VLVFATGNRGIPITGSAEASLTHDVRTVDDRAIDPLFEATAEATEAAIVNALLAAETLRGRDGITAHALPHERVLEIMASHGRPTSPP
jgi:D-aminopeptidase